jgi:hypothetical protein
MLQLNADSRCITPCLDQTSIDHGRDGFFANKAEF